MSHSEHLYERTVASRSIFKGRVIQVKVDEVLLPNGQKAEREIVNHQGAVAILPLTDDGKMIAVRQFRKALERTLVEIPAGKLEAGEEPLTCAQRELLEETGYQASQFELHSSFYTSPGFADELIYLYIATGLTAGEQQPDEDEFVDVLTLTFPEAQQLWREGQIQDAKTIVALLAWEKRLMSRED